MSEILIYTAADGQVELNASLAEDTVWLSLNQLSDLFGRDKLVISRHSLIFEINETDHVLATMYLTIL